MEEKICPKCGSTKFPVYIADIQYLRCINCQKTIEEVKIANGCNVKD